MRTSHHCSRNHRNPGYQQRLNGGEHHSPQCLLRCNSVTTRWTALLAGERTCADALDGNGLGPLSARREGLLWLVQSGVEEGINKRRFSQTGFTLRHQR